MADSARDVPPWVPRPVYHYLAHTEFGEPIRALARQAGCHASTVLRQIRMCEARREDPLVDDALRRLGRRVSASAGTGSAIKECRMTIDVDHDQEQTELSETRLKQEGLRVLRRLSEPHALLVVAATMDKAVILRDRAGQDPTRTGIVDKDVAEAMALKGWIDCHQAGRVARYHITGPGREMLNRLVAEGENRAMGFAEDQSAFAGAEMAAPRRRRRYAAAESPLIALARRKDKEGHPFLSDALVRAGERLREDFELAQMGERTTQNWDSYLTGGCAPGSGGGPGGGRSMRSRQCVADALRDLGPGLGDVALRCCCFLEGLERVEQRMGWSARSGKIVLRIALQRLKRHYEQQGDAGDMIG